MILFLFFWVPPFCILLCYFGSTQQSTILYNLSVSQFQPMCHNPNPNMSQPQQALTFKQANLMMREFVKERDWEKYHTPRNLVMALVGEVGEIAEIFQWKGEVQPGLVGFKQSEKVHVGEEIADVLNYLIRLADVCGIDMETAFRDKMNKIRRKYPQEQVRADGNYFLEIKEQRRLSREASSYIKEQESSQTTTDNKQTWQTAKETEEPQKSEIPTLSQTNQPNN